MEYKAGESSVSEAIDKLKEEVLSGNLTLNISGVIVGIDESYFVASELPALSTSQPSDDTTDTISNQTGKS